MELEASRPAPSNPAAGISQKLPASTSFSSRDTTSRSRSTSPPHASGQEPRTLSVRNIQGGEEYGLDACPPRIPFRI